jgi:hypothetical protein
MRKQKFMLKPIAMFLAMLACAPSTVTAAENNLTKIQDLHYREVLFDFYNNDPLNGLARIRYARQAGLLPDYVEDIDLTEGQLEYAFNMPAFARQTFNAALAKLPEADKDKAWFYLARLSYDDGEYTSAHDALEKIIHELPRFIENEKRYMQAVLLAQQKRFDEAKTVVQRIDKKSPWRQYANFNLGVAMIRARQTGEGIKKLNEVARFKAKQDEQKSIKDKANLTMGYFYLRERNYSNALNYFRNVRLKSPFSNKALLGMGWAESERKNYADALGAWDLLTQRDLMDVTVQEALLASSFAFNKLGDERQALQHYNDAIQSYAQIQSSVDQAITNFRTGLFAETLARYASLDDAMASRVMKQDFDHRKNMLFRYMLDNPEFMRVFRSYRDLSALRKQLLQWRRDIEVYQEALYVNNNQGQSQVNQTRQQKNNELRRLVKYHTQLEKKIDSVAASGNFVALLRNDEIEMLQHMQELSKQLRTLPRGRERNQAVLRLKTLRGNVLWKAMQEYPQRLDEIKGELNQAGDQIRAGLGVNGFHTVSNGASGGQVDQDLTGRIEKALSETELLMDKHEQLMQHHALIALNERRNQLVTYLSQARFAVAQIFDQANSEAN